MIYNRVVVRFDSKHHAIIDNINWFFDIEVPFIEENFGMAFTYYSGELSQYFSHLFQKVKDWMSYHVGQALIVDTRTNNMWGTNDLAAYFKGFETALTQAFQNFMADPWAVLTSDEFLEVFLSMNIVNLTIMLFFL